MLIMAVAAFFGSYAQYMLGLVVVHCLIGAGLVMIVGKKTYGIVGHFPPTPSDPVLRLIFPRAVKPTDKTVLFRLYLGGLNFPEREAEFHVKELTYQGKLEM